MTDTIAPYPDSTTCYAEFSVLANLTTQVHFKSWVDTYTSEAIGSFEAYDNWALQWVDLSDQVFWLNDYAVHILPYNSGPLPVFGGTSSAWASVGVEFECLGIAALGEAFSDTLRFRFKFNSSSNIAGRDGWMVDSIRVITGLSCTSGIDENVSILSSTYPSPASSRVHFETDIPYGSPLLIRVLYPLGRFVLRQEGNYGERFSVAVDQLPSGTYAYQLISGDRSSSGHFVVAH